MITKIAPLIATADENPTTRNMDAVNSVVARAKLVVSGAEAAELDAMVEAFWARHR